MPMALTVASGVRIQSRIHHHHVTDMDDAKKGNMENEANGNTNFLLPSTNCVPSKMIE